MKLQTAALALLVSGSAVSAFAPTTKPFGTRAAVIKTSSRRSQSSWALPSTTVRKGEVDISQLISTNDTSGKDVNRHLVIAKTTEQARAAALSYMKQYEGQSGAAVVYSKLQEHGVKVVNG